MAFVVLGFLLAGYYFYKWQYPYGIRTGALPCIVSALVVYSSNHDGWFPKGATNTAQDLQSLVPSYTHIESLAGLSGDIQAIQQAFKEGRYIPPNATSWVYHPGFRHDDPPELAIIWEKQDGITYNGQRCARGSHAVGFANGSYLQIEEQQWENFLSDQKNLRNAILSARNHQ